MSEPVTLESIMACFRGVVPSSFATCAADGTPNISFLSLVHYVDAGRVGLSRQFFNKTRVNLDVNPFGQVRVVDPGTLAEFALDLRYLHTETEGATFDTMAAAIEASAAGGDMSGVFRLRGVDVHQVLRCAPVGVVATAPQAPVERDVLGRLDEFTRRLSQCGDYAEATRTALRSLDDLFGFTQSILLVGDEGDGHLFAVAGNGYPSPAAGAEVPLSAGVIGMAADRRQVVCVSNVARGRVMQHAMSGGCDSGPGIPLPALDAAGSVAAVPLVVQGGLTGVLYLESAAIGTFGPHNERVLRLLGGYVAAALSGLAADEPAREADGPPALPAPTGTTLRITYYQADDSVFAGDGYVIKGVAGRILWKLLGAHAADGRTAFTNRELRLDEALGLPPGNDNLEARLLVLRKRLAAGGHGVQIERTGRGHFALLVTRPLELLEVPTSGPMRSAHAK
ncbi:hypothetical protein DSM112329_03663 [Paraconexibacter sp. AEG42_29]|uniref:GAF domain-containing protein n=1 Tax=Paraconexibacter sp. AEG42_29 TaxID=2997339 RepID=A0AAU7AYU3_9ACTN